MANAARRWLYRPLAAGVAPAALAEEFRSACRRVPPVDPEGRLGSEASWVRFTNRLRELALTGNPAEFLGWDVIEQTMSVGAVDYIDREFEYLRSRPDWRSRWRPIVRESMAGSPRLYLRHPWTSRNLVHSAYHVAQFEEKTGRRPGDYELILEFGGGYGSMCRLCHDAGFRGTYLIFDLPLFSALQAYYLGLVGLRMGGDGVRCVSSLDELKALLSGRDLTNSLFIATWSLCECPVSFRDQFSPFAEGFGGYLMAYQDQYHEVENAPYFRRWRERAPGIRWREWPIEHLPRPRSFYLVGAREERQLGPEKH